MSKVKLTREQVEVIEKVRDSLKGLSYKSLYIALNEGYEIKEEFKLGEYIVYENDVVKNTMKIIAINKENITVEPIYEGFKNHNVVGINSPLIRHATPEEIAEEKERRWWAKRGRKVWELKEGDVMRDLVVGDVFIVHRNLIVMPENKTRYEVICFVENRPGEENE